MVLVVGALSGGPVTAQSPGPAGFASAIEESHGRPAWAARRALETDLRIEFGGKVAIEGNLIFRTDAGASRLTLNDGTVATFDGRDAWVAPASSTIKRARFHVLTWPYFAAVSMKLRDEGAHLELLGMRKLFGKPHQAARLTFGSGVGDTPDDWYVLYQDPKTRRLVGMGYIVTFGTPKAKAEKEPHAISYDGFVDLGGAWLSTAWTFWNWNEAEGAVGPPLGKGTLGNPRFVDPPRDAFTAPPGARKEDLPRP
jgi:hypothetical protein